MNWEDMSPEKRREALAKLDRGLVQMQANDDQFEVLLDQISDLIETIAVHGAERARENLSPKEFDIVVQAMACNLHSRNIRRNFQAMRDSSAVDLSAED